MKKALFRLPNQNRFFSVQEDETNRVVASFFPFNQEEKSVKIFGNKVDEINESELKDFFADVELKEKLKEIRIPTVEEYIKKIEKTIKIVKEKHWKKLVISRPKSVEFQQIDWNETYRNLCEKYSNAFCYVWIDEDQIWLGATPEILGKYHQPTQTFETMSLAGTLPFDEEWTSKEIEEQKPVTDYIQQILSKYSNDTEISETYSHISGNIKHLRNDFKCIVDENQLYPLIQDLHPTPAVCGIPKEDCRKEIITIEDYNREFYAGYIQVEIEDVIYFFVNLRCAQVFKNQCVAYVGGGITAKSNPQKEWQETELKSQAVLGSLVTK